MRRFLLPALAVAACMAGACVAGPQGAQAATPPKQPASGPGGSDYVAADVTKRVIGTASAATYAFYPAAPAKDPRPVVVFLHSWGAANPGLYGGWIDHLARRGNLVLFPRFQEPNRTRPMEATANAAALIKSALEALASDPDAKPDLKRVAFIGHLAGVPIAFNLAAEAEQDGIPAPKLVFGLMPGGIASDEKSRGILLKDLSAIPASTLLITMTGDREHLPADRAARRLMTEAAGVPGTRKLFMRAGSDDHGFPTLTATLTSPGAKKDAYDASVLKLPPDPPKDPKQRSTWKWTPDMSLTGEQTVLTQQLANNPTDTLDYLAYWKTFDMAAAAAFSGQDATALRREPRFIDMENWSDGWPVRRLSADLPKGTEEQQQGRGPRRRLN
ncbi:dienelactone hydrolase family protein [Microvirga pudoricolor]|uniref:dienelactone hydrolase family protein n=1 Tax=Microvirga pudoricolor TaxID=2778729 RepID=UPI00194FDF99|nr:hypothetical protein [Microvirga pudoricolor]MBM6595946.1 hypothetical protein [Microvirga pudoricolor]